jgi:hypothetical protein
MPRRWLVNYLFELIRAKTLLRSPGYPMLKFTTSRSQSYYQEQEPSTYVINFSLR